MENNCLHYASSVYRHMFLDKTLLQPARSLSLIFHKIQGTAFSTGFSQVFEAGMR